MKMAMMIDSIANDEDRGEGHWNYPQKASSAEPHSSSSNFISSKLYKTCITVTS